MSRISLLLLALLTLTTSAEITVNDLSDETIYTDSVTFSVVHDDGFGFQVLINGDSYGTGEPITIDQPEFYELVVNKFDGLELVESKTVHFIVLSSDRGNSERGLTDWVPRPNLLSSTAAIDSGTLTVVLPRAFPPDLPVPVVARLRAADGEGTVRVMADAKLEDEVFRLYRGAGGMLFTPEAPDGGGSVGAETSAGSQSVFKSVFIEGTPNWIDAPATIGNDTTWPSGARVRINGDLTIASGATLTVRSGSVVLIGDGVDLNIDGSLEVHGDEDDPVIFTAAPGSTWGGCFVQGDVFADHLFVVGGGEDDDWFSDSGFSAHRKEQATFLFDSNSVGFFVDCYWIDNPGQPLHGKDASITLDRCVIQRSPTTGQFNGGAVTVRDSHLIEFPLDSPEFADDDNDGIYFTTGDHRLINSVIGWAKDDGVDAGSGSSGTVRIERCWFESCFHEGMALSGGGREVKIEDSVAINCGQGIECGYSEGDNSPLVDVERSICIGNLVGWRFGDNYDWDYNGFLSVTESIALFNSKDVWGYEWDSWTYRSDAMDIRGNHLTFEDPLHPDNTAWNSEDRALLDALQPTAGVVGSGFASTELQRPLQRYGEPVQFALSSFTSSHSGLIFTISYKLRGEAEKTNIFGGLSMTPGQMLADYSPTSYPRGAPEYIRISVGDGNNGEITTPRHLIYIDTPGIDNVQEILPLGSSWAYLDDGSDPGPGWQEENFDDSSWKWGPAQLGYGDDGEVTVLDDSPGSYPTYYFRREFEPEDLRGVTEATLRLLRDDGAIVYLNGVEVLRSNMPDGSVTHSDFAAATVANESDLVVAQIDPSLLIEDDDNILAVEVHQANANSSDVSFDLELTAERPLDPALHISPLGDGRALVIWAAEDGIVLEESTDLIDWAAVSATSPMEIESGPIARTLFFRLAELP